MRVHKEKTEREEVEWNAQARAAKNLIKPNNDIDKAKSCVQNLLE